MSALSRAAVLSIEKGEEIFGGWTTACMATIFVDHISQNVIDKATCCESVSDKLWRGLLSEKQFSFFDENVDVQASLRNVSKWPEPVRFHHNFSKTKVGGVPDLEETE